jgi:hypothetical protein
VILAGGVTLQKERFESEKSLQNKELQDLIASELWKKEDKKKEKGAKSTEETKQAEKK